jgi:serine/threonine protein kinase
MTKIVENYVLLEQLRGTGSFGEIYRAKHIATEEIFAIRMLMFDKFLKSSSLQEVLINEV